MEKSRRAGVTRSAPRATAFRRRWASLLVGMLPFFFTAPAHAVNNATLLEVPRGAVTAPARMLAMGGAGMALAEGSIAFISNAAALAQTSSEGPPRGWRFDALFTLARSFGNYALFENNRSWQSASTLRRGLFGLSLGYGRFGFGFGLQTVGYHFCEGQDCALSERDPVRSADITKFSLGVAYSFYEDQLKLGILSTQGSLDAKKVVPGIDSEATIAHGFGFEIGALWTPKDKPYRLGGQFRSRLSAHPEPGKFAATGIPSVRFPRAFILGGATYIARHSDSPVPPAAAFSALGSGILLAADVAFITPERASSFGAWLADETQMTVHRWTIEPRLGAAAQLWPERAIVRAGTYLDISRYPGIPARVHGTIGLDLKLGKVWRTWCLMGALDGARHWFNWTVSLGFWPGD